MLMSTLQYLIENYYEMEICYVVFFKKKIVQVLLFGYSFGLESGCYIWYQSPRFKHSGLDVLNRGSLCFLRRFLIKISFIGI